MKNHKIGFCMVPVGPRAKVSITDPPQVWVKGSIVVDRNRNFSSAIMKKSYIFGFTWSLVVLEQKCQLLSTHKFGSRVPLLLTEIKISCQPLWKITHFWFYTVPGGLRAKVSITEHPQVWVKGSIVVDGNRNFNFGHYEKSQNWVLHGPCWSQSKSINYWTTTSLDQGFYVVDGNENFNFGQYEKSQNWVLHGPCWS